MHILTPRRELILPVRFGMSGWWKLTATNTRTGRQRLLADWFPNLITDWGLNEKGTTSTYLNQYCHVGSGSAAPEVTDSTLETWVASTDNQQAQSEGAQASAPYYGWQRKTYRFAEGVAEGNLSEIGVSPLGGSADNLFSRALILDALGSPTSITILADEVLDATYEIRSYPPTTDGEFTVSDGATSYDIITRAASVTGNRWGYLDILGKAVIAVTGANAFSGDIDAITNQPNGSSDRASSASATTYSNNSLKAEGEMFWGLNDGNFAGGIRSLGFGGWLANAGAWQAQFTPEIDKDDTKELTIGVSIGWGRASI